MLIVLLHRSKLDGIQQKTSSLANENQVGFRATAAKISQSAEIIKTENKASFNTVTSRLDDTDAANEARSKRILACFDDQVQGNIENVRAARKAAMEQRKVFAMTKTMLDRVDSGFTSNLREHEITRKVIGNFHQLLRPRTSRQHLRWGSHSSIISISGFARCCLRLPFGCLYIRRVLTLRSKGSPQSPSEESRASETEITFVPPLWLSNLAIQYCMALDYRSGRNEW